MKYAQWLIRRNQKDSTTNGTNSQSIASIFSFDIYDSLQHAAMQKNTNPKAASTGKRSGLLSSCRMSLFGFVVIV